MLPICFRPFFGPQVIPFITIVGAHLVAVFSFEAPDYGFQTLFKLFSASFWRRFPVKKNKRGWALTNESTGNKRT